ncbi:hypothetical protein FACS1894184_14530 [Clostridia bacterium]|nr:hypothetical protein FACS1894184_14530 [Clostridia bacterium]
MPNSIKYWRDRADATSKLIRERKAPALEEITRAYQHAAREITGSIGSIFRAYQYRHHLTTDEAARALAEPPSQEEYKKMWARLNALDPLTDEYMTLDQISSARAYAFRISLQAAKLQTTQLTLASLAQTQHSATTEYLKQAFGLSAEAVREQLQSRLGLRIKLASLSSTVMVRVLKHQWSGMNYSERIWKSMDALQTTLKDVMTDGLLLGSSLDDMALEISDRMGVALSNARRLVRTESTYVNNQVALESYKQAGLDQYEYVTAKDERVCAVCGPLNTQRFKVSEAVIGENLPPMHPNCRCSTIAVMDAKAAAAESFAEPLPEPTYSAIMSKVSKIGGDGLAYIGRIDRRIYSVVSDDIVTDEVINTDRQMTHIVKEHGGHVPALVNHLREAVEEPDYILADPDFATAVVLKEVIMSGERLKVILRLAVSTDEPEHKNSIITSFLLSERTWRKYLRNKSILYRRDGI